MPKNLGKRDKSCDHCNKKENTLYRIRHKAHDKTWVFVCKECLLTLKENNPHYQYGGTWKR